MGGDATAALVAGVLILERWRWDKRVMCDLVYWLHLYWPLDGHETVDKKVEVQAVTEDHRGCRR